MGLIGRNVKVLRWSIYNSESLAVTELAKYKMTKVISIPRVLQHSTFIVCQAKRSGSCFF
jgi:hypothetical protein